VIEFIKRVFRGVSREFSQGHTPGTAQAAVYYLLEARARVEQQADVLADDITDAVNARITEIDRLDDEIDQLDRLSVNL
jgi:transposase